MCFTKTTVAVLCLHTTQAHTPCRSKKLFSMLRRCKPSISEVYSNTFCPSCISFWDVYHISSEESRALIMEFRIQHEYHGPATPVLKGQGPILGFVVDQVVSGNGESISVNGLDDEVRTLSAINMWEAIQQIAPPQSTVPNKNALVLPIWASCIVSELAFDAEEADLGMQMMGLCEGGEYGNEMAVPKVSELLKVDKDGLIPPEEFDLGFLDRPLSGPVNHEGFERQSVVRTVVPASQTHPGV